MDQYLSTLDVIRLLGVHKGDRTGTGTQSHFGMQRRYSLRGNRLPVVTTKKIHLHSVIHELIWMLSGDTRVDYLISKGVRIWNEWVKPETAVYVSLTAEEVELAVNKFIGGEYHVNFHADADRPGAVIYHVNDYKDETSYDPPVLEEGTELILDVNTHCYGQHRQAVAELDSPAQYMGILYRLLLNKEPQKLVGGDLGPVYGKTWRDIDDTRIVPKIDWTTLESRGFQFVVDIPGTDLSTDQCVVTRKIDQVQDIVDQLTKNPDSRRIIICAWDPRLVDDQALPPCHSFIQFWTRELSFDERLDWLQVNEPAIYEEIGHQIKDDSSAPGYFEVCEVPKRAISCQMYQRSSDQFLGNCFNVTFYSLLTHMLANQLNMLADEFIWTGGDCHIYKSHVEQVDLQLTREPYDVPTIQFKPESKGKDIRSITDTDFEILNYVSHPHIAGKVAV